MGSKGISATLKWDDSKLPDLRSEFTDITTSLNDIVCSEDDVNTVTKRYSKLVFETAYKTIGKDKKIGGWLYGKRRIKSVVHPPWYCPICIDAHVEYITALENVRDLDSLENSIKYSKCRNQLSSHSRRCQAVLDIRRVRIP